MNNRLFTVFTIAFLSLLAATFSFAQTVQVTNNTQNDVIPFLDDGLVTWRGFDGNDWEIFVYNSSIGVTTQITNNLFDDGIGFCSQNPIWDCDKPRISNGRIVWAGFDGNDWEIFLYDVSSGTIAQITNNNVNDLNPRIDGNIVAYRGFDGNDDEVFSYNIASGITTQITNDNFWFSSLWVSQGRIVWSNFDGMDTEIFFYDTATLLSTQVTNNNYSDNQPKINPYLISWQGLVDPDNEVFIYDLATGITTQLTNNNLEDRENDPDLTDNALTWEEFDGIDWEIFHYNNITGVTTQITNNIYDDYDAWIEGGKIVWIGFDGSDTEIYYFDIGSGRRLQITNNTLADDFPPRVNGGQITWAGCDDVDCANGIGDYEIFLYSIVPMPDIKANGSNGPVVVPSGSIVTVTVSLDPATYVGTPADYWVAAATPNGIYWYNYTTGQWVQSPTPVRAYGGPLTNFNNYTVLNTTTLPVGPTFFYFAVDNNANNILDATWWDYVVVKVE